MKKDKMSFGTHSGPFHADEVTSCALLIVFDIIDKKKVIRSRDPEVLKSCEYICDIGGHYDPLKKLFDHHQSSYKGNMSSAGMILKYLNDQDVVDKELFVFLYDKLIKGVDDHDNGIMPKCAGHMTFSAVVENFNPPSYNAKNSERDKNFFAAVDFVVDHLRRMILRRKDIMNNREAVFKVMQNSTDVLVFDKELPWQESFFALGGESHSAKFVIMPCQGQWKLRGIPPSTSDLMNVRIPLPLAWGGKLEGELSEVTGIKGAVFCHKARFISIWKSKEDAIKAYEKVMGDL